MIGKSPTTRSTVLGFAVLRERVRRLVDGQHVGFEHRRLGSCQTTLHLTTDPTRSRSAEKVAPTGSSTPTAIGPVTSGPRCPSGTPHEPGTRRGGLRNATDPIIGPSARRWATRPPPPCSPAERDTDDRSAQRSRDSAWGTRTLKSGAQHAINRKWATEGDQGQFGPTTPPACKPLWRAEQRPLDSYQGF